MIEESTQQLLSTVETPSLSYSQHHFVGFTAWFFLRAICSPSAHLLETLFNVTSKYLANTVPNMEAVWPVVWLIAVLVKATCFLATNKNAINACESNYYCLNIVILIVNLIISDIYCNVYLKNQPRFSTVRLDIYLSVRNEHIM